MEIPDKLGVTVDQVPMDLKVQEAINKGKWVTVNLSKTVQQLNGNSQDVLSLQTGLETKINKSKAD